MRDLPKPYRAKLNERLPAIVNAPRPRRILVESFKLLIQKIKKPAGAGFLWNLAPREGFEPPTNRLTAGCSTAELPGKNSASPYSHSGPDIPARPVVVTTKSAPEAAPGPAAGGAADGRWRPGPESNRRVRDLQSRALPLCYPAACGSTGAPRGRATYRSWGPHGSTSAVGRAVRPPRYDCHSGANSL